MPFRKAPWQQFFVVENVSNFFWNITLITSYFGVAANKWGVLWIQIHRAHHAIVLSLVRKPQDDGSRKFWPGQAALLGAALWWGVTHKAGQWSLITAKLEEDFIHRPLMVWVVSTSLQHKKSPLQDRATLVRPVWWRPCCVWLLI